MRNLTLEQELTARIFLHKTAILGGVLMKNFIDRESQSAVTLPPFQMEEQADTYSNAIMQQALRDGTFDDLYENAWEEVKDHIDEHVKVI